MEVVIERVMFLLRDFYCLSFVNGLVLMKVVLRGMGNLFRFNGRILISDRLVGVNQLGEVKVWMN